MEAVVVYTQQPLIGFFTSIFRHTMTIIHPLRQMNENYFFRVHVDHRFDESSCSRRCPVKVIVSVAPSGRQCLYPTPTRSERLAVLRVRHSKTSQARWIDGVNEKSGSRTDDDHLAFKVAILSFLIRFCL